MKRLSTSILLAMVLVSCDLTTKKTNNMADQKKQTPESTSSSDTTPRVTGIGGIFFFSDNPKETKEWYAKNLGLDINEWGSSSFESRDLNNPDQINSLQWSPFKKGDEYFSPSKKRFHDQLPCSAYRSAC